MTPQEAVNVLVAAGWTEARIATAVRTSQPTIHRIKHGVQRRGANFDTCMALLDLAAREIAEPEPDPRREVAGQGGDAPGPQRPTAALENAVKASAAVVNTNQLTGEAA